MTATLSSIFPTKHLRYSRKIKPKDKLVSDGTVPGLYLVPTETSAGTGKWIVRFVSPATGKRREMGLPSDPTTSIPTPASKPWKGVERSTAEKNPLDLPRAPEREIARLASVPTFEAAARQHHADKAEDFRNTKHTE
ncbi:hypothetical protein D3C73_671180 [compost metagenome]